MPRLGLHYAAAAARCGAPSPMRAHLLLISALLAYACVDKEAADPSVFAAGDDALGGAEREGNPGPTGDAAPSAKAAVRARVATRAECEAAAKHLEEVALDVQVAMEEDAKKRAALRAQRDAALASAEVTAHIGEVADECVKKQTTAHEAQCIARAKDEAGIDACLDAH